LHLETNDDLAEQLSAFRALRRLVIPKLCDTIQDTNELRRLAQWLH